MKGLEAVAERLARARGERLLARVADAAAAHAPGATIDRQSNECRVRGRGLRRRWISEPALRFARRIQP